MLRGNLAPDGAVIKPSACAPQYLRHTGPALVFDDYASMKAAVDDPELEVTADHILVLRNAGPQGGPGMPEWGQLPTPTKLVKQGVRDMLRLSDARMSGVAGVVTDGGFRDSPDIAKLPFPAYHQRPSAPTNLTLHQALDINVPVGCGDVPVFPGDIVVGDAEGVIVIPAHLPDEVAAEATEMTAFEDFVSEQVLEGRSIIGLYPPTDEQARSDFAAWRQARGR